MNEMVKTLAAKLQDICGKPAGGGVVINRSVDVFSDAEKHKVDLPGDVLLIGGSPVFIPSHKVEFYEVRDASYLFIRALAMIGVSEIVLYMPATILDEQLPAVVAVEDHIMMAIPPHVGVNPSEGEQRFFSMGDAYDFNKAIECMTRCQFQPASAVLLGVGPGQFDSPAGKKAAISMGAGIMSVHIAGQCLVAKRASMRVVAYAELAKVGGESLSDLIRASLPV